MRFLSVIAMFYCLVNSLGDITVQSQESDHTSHHASIRAYPDAIISVTDATSGIIVSIDPDGRSVFARNPAGAEIWRKDVLQETGLPSEGFPVVRHVAIIEGGKVSLVIGKHRYVEGDLEAGNLKLVGED